MKRFTQQFNKEAQKISLTAREREELLSRVEAYMEYHPLPHAVKEESPSTITPLRVTEPMRFIRIPRRFLMATTTVTAMFLLVVVPAMAEQSMPGNFLHPIKVHVNEEIRGSFLSGEERVRWETERVERRLAEARRLAILGRLTPEIEARVAESVTKQKNIAREQIAVLETADVDAATMATMAMASMFVVQETLLESVRPTNIELPSELSRVLENSKEETIAKAGGSIVSEARLLAMIEQHSTRAYELLIGLEKNIDQIEQDNITRRLNDVERTLAEYTGDEVVSDEEKLAGLREVWSDLQKLISYMNSLRDKTSVEVEQVVPIRLTYDERASKLQDEHTALKVRFEKLQQLSERHATNESLEKFRFVATDINEKLNSVSTLNAANIRVVEEKIGGVRDQLESIEKTISPELWHQTEENTDNTGSGGGESGNTNEERSDEFEDGIVEDTVDGVI